MMSSLKIFFPAAVMLIMFFWYIQKEYVSILVVPPAEKPVPVVISEYSNLQRKIFAKEYGLAFELGREKHNIDDVYNKASTDQVAVAPTDSPAEDEIRLRLRDETRNHLFSLRVTDDSRYPMTPFIVGVHNDVVDVDTNWSDAAQQIKQKAMNTRNTHRTDRIVWRGQEYAHDVRLKTRALAAHRNSH